MADQNSLQEQRIKVEGVRILYAQALFPSISMLLISSAIVGIFWETQSHQVLLTWLAANFVLFGLRGILIWLFPKNATDADVMQRWGWMFTFTTLLTGFLWGSLVWLILDLSSVFNALTIMLVLIIMMAGTLGIYATFFPAYVAFALPTVFLMVARLASEGEEFFFLSFILLGFLVAFLIYSLMHYRLVNESTRQRFENIDLLHGISLKKEEAEKANADKTRFLASASHDLRQPIHAMDLFADALEQEMTTGKQQLLLGKLRESMDSMGSLLNSLLNMSKLEAELIEVKPHALIPASIFAKMKDEFLQQAQEKGLEFQVATDAMQDSVYSIQSDDILLENILRNLLSNAIKYTDHGKIYLTCIKQGDACIISIEDTGIGIAEDEQGKVFDAFYQIDNPERDRSKGIGLGLSIVKRLCQLLDHHIEMHSAPGKGTRFEMTIPCVVTSEPQAYVPRIYTPSLKRGELTITILVIDDEKAIQDGMQAMLEPWGCHVLTCGSSEESIPLLQSNPDIDLVIADYRLRGGDLGTDAISSVREILGRPSLPSIIISGDTEPTRMQEMQKAGFEMLHKPVKPMQMRALIQHVMRDINRKV